MFDLAIIGGGPAGIAAGVYAARKQLRTVFITADFGGQSTVSEKIENWIGTPALSGAELALNLEKHLRAYEGQFLTIKTGERVEAIAKAGSNFNLTVGGEALEARALLIASGAQRRKLTVPGAANFEQKGITYCASCDGPLFSGQAVAVIGGGNAAFETALQLLAYCSKVTLLHHGADFKADEITVAKVRQNPKAVLLTNAETSRFTGGKFVESLWWKNKLTGAETELKVGGVFVEIGLIPNTGLVKDLVKLTPTGQIIVDPKTQASSLPGIWAAGDCTDGLYHQNNIAAGDAIKALENIYQSLHRQ
jgi:alkyl hydroperoxide reductase subunit F